MKTDNRKSKLIESALSELNSFESILSESIPSLTPETKVELSDEKTWAMALPVKGIDFVETENSSNKKTKADKIQKGIHDVQNRVNTLVQALDVTYDDYAQKLRDDYQAKIKNIEGLKLKWQTDIRRIKTSHFQVVDKYKKLFSDYQTKLDELKNNKQEIEGLKAKLANADSLSSEKQNQIQKNHEKMRVEFNEKIHALQSEKLNILGHNEALKKLILKNQKHVQDLMKNIEGIEKISAQYKSDYDNAVVELKKNKIELVDTKEQLSQYKKKFNEANKRLNIKTTQIEKRKKYIEMLHQKNEDEKQVIQKIIGDTQQEKEDLLFRNLTLTAEVKDLVQKVDFIEKMSAEHEKAKEFQTRENFDLTRRINDIKERFQETHTENKKLGTELEAHKLHIVDLQKHVQARDEQIKNLDHSSVLREYEDQIYALNSKNTGMERAIEKLLQDSKDSEYRFVNKIKELELNSKTLHEDLVRKDQLIADIKDDLLTLKNIQRERDMTAIFDSLEETILNGPLHVFKEKLTQNISKIEMQLGADDVLPAQRKQWEDQSLYLTDLLKIVKKMQEELKRNLSQGQSDENDLTVL